MLAADVIFFVNCLRHMSCYIYYIIINLFGGWGCGLWKYGLSTMICPVEQ